MAWDLIAGNSGDIWKAEYVAQINSNFVALAKQESGAPSFVFSDFISDQASFAAVNVASDTNVFNMRATGVSSLAGLNVGSAANLYNMKVANISSVAGLNVSSYLTVQGVAIGGTGFGQYINSEDIVSNVGTFDHGLGIDFPVVYVTNNNRQRVEPDLIIHHPGDDRVSIIFSSFTILNSWHITALKT